MVKSGNKNKNIRWHELSTGQTLQLLETTPQGLSNAEAQARLDLYGKNQLPEPKQPGLVSIFLRQFKSPLIYILLIAAGIVLAMGELVDAGTILAVLLINAAIGTIQEGKAQNTFQALKKLATSQATVLRDDETLILSDALVVPGDIILLSEGEKIPADARVISSAGLRVNESSLTGESIPVDKSAEPVHAATAGGFQDKANMVFRGTYAVLGSAKAVVVATGEHTAIGGISRVLTSVDREIPLQRNIRYLSRWLIAIVLVIAIALFIFGVLTGQTPRDMFGTVVSLAVSIIPEGLPVAITLVLARGVFRMSKRNALVKKLQAVEALGQADVIAVDKTGTITKNELRVTAIITPKHTFTVTGSGFNPAGEILLNKTVINPGDYKDLKQAALIFALCATAERKHDPATNTWKISGDPTDAALLVCAEKCGLKKQALLAKHPLLVELPFSYTTKLHATVHKFGKTDLLSVIGAPEAVLEHSKLTPKEKAVVQKKFSALAKKGLRVLGFGYKNNPGTIATSLPTLTFGGLVAISDTLQESAVEAVEKLTDAGVKTIMITGDNKLTAQAIAESAGIYKPGDTIVTGEDLQKFNVNRTTTVFARITPEHKMAIIQALDKHGHTVAMTGDGVNDAPPLVAADLGIAMGVRGTEVAKEAADIVLLDDNLESIVAAVEEGRSIYKTIKKILLYLFSTSLGELGVVVGAIALGLPLPLLPVQIIWLNFVTDGFLTVALGLEPKENGLLKKEFKRPNKYLLDMTMVKQMLFMGTGMVVVGLVLFLENYQVDVVRAQSITLTALAMMQWFNAWNVRSETKSIFTLNPLTNPWLICATLVVILLQLGALFHPLFQRLLHTVPLTTSDLLLAFVVSTSIIWIEELRKFGSFLTKKLTY